MQAPEPRDLPSIWTVLAVLLVIHLTIPLLKMLVPLLVILAALLALYRVFFYKRI
jgi:hypothetical protein